MGFLECVGQPSHEGVVCSRIVTEDQPREQTSVHKQSLNILCVAEYDGDTIKVANNEEVRLIGIDAPELSDKTKFHEVIT